MACNGGGDGRRVVVDLGSEQLTVWDPSWSAGLGGHFQRVGVAGLDRALVGCSCWRVEFGVDLGRADRGGRSLGVRGLAWVETWALK